MKGLIFTYVWAFNLQSEKEYIDSISALFRANGARVSFVELYAPLATRLERNETELRLEHKASKRDRDWSRSNVLEMESEHRMNTANDFYYPEDCLKIDNSELTPDAVADLIIERFKLAI